MREENSIDKYLSPKWLESNEYENKRNLIRKETNKYPMVIDYGCFKKTAEEKAKLYGEKESWKNLNKKASA